MRMSADQNLSFHYGGAFPPSFSNQNLVPFPPAAMSNVARLISEGMYASDGASNMGGMILPDNPVTQSYTSSVLSLPGNLSRNIILDPVPPLKLTPAATASWSLEEVYVLREGLIEHATEPTNIMKYIKIAAKLPEKTVRDVAMRCRLIAKETGKRRKLRSYCVEKKRASSAIRVGLSEILLPPGENRPDNQTLGHCRPPVPALRVGFEEEEAARSGRNKVEAAA
ncbi:uncharacterized protein LOC141812296 [Curcuma longa]|uniref:uncharacterized protein LOC141812296 n=1 Tax=Curcuma longa TaxID=136217 RepID=UPI003D9E3046